MCIPPHVGLGKLGQTFRLSYTEEVVGSIPIPPTQLPLDIGVFDPCCLTSMEDIVFNKGRVTAVIHLKTTG